MQYVSNFSLRPKTTMRIGGTARYFAELQTKQDMEDAYRFSLENKIKLLPLGSGSNTIFAPEVDALVVQIKHMAVQVDGDRVTVGAGKNLPMLISALAGLGLDLSPLSGIPGTVGGAIFGNAGQGPSGVWIDSFIESVTIYDGTWKTLMRSECGFQYRESGFKHQESQVTSHKQAGPIIWEATLRIPKAHPEAIEGMINTLLQKRIETQPHLKTAGSCFKAVGATPAWKLIDAAGLRGLKVGDIEISPKHANFLINTGQATYADAISIVENVKQKIPENLSVEMRFIEPDGSLRF